MTFNPLIIGSIQESGASALMTYSTTGSPVLRTHTTYSSLTWTGSGSFTILTNPNSLTFDYMIVAGGGAGGTTDDCMGGGGGGGGVRVFTSQSLSIAAHTVTIGAGGTAAWNVTTSGSGGNTTFSSNTTTGGGGGGNRNPGIGYPSYGYQVGATGGAGGGGGTSRSHQGAAGGAGNQGSYSPVEGVNGATGFVDWGYPTINNQGAGGGGGGATLSGASGGGTGTTQTAQSWTVKRKGSAGQTNNYMTGATITDPYTGGTTAFGGGGGAPQAQGNSYPGFGGLLYRLDSNGGEYELDSTGCTAGGTGRGGAGSSYSGAASAPGAGVANSGGGGGGRYPDGNVSSRLGGNGGSGVVVLRWVTEG